MHPVETVKDWPILECPEGEDESYEPERIHGINVLPIDDPPGIYPDEPNCGPSLTIFGSTKRVHCKDTDDGRQFCYLNLEEIADRPEHRRDLDFTWQAFHVDNVSMPDETLHTRGNGWEEWVFQPEVERVSDDKATKTWMQCVAGHRMDITGGVGSGFILNCTSKTEKLGIGYVMEMFEDALEEAGYEG